MKWLFRRWQLKGLALIMAIAVYFFTGTQITVERTLTVQVSPENLRGLPANYILAPMVPREFDITIAGPKSVVEDLSPQAIEPIMTLGTDGLTAGFQEFDITERLLRLNPSLVLRGRSTDRIRVEFSRVIEEVLTLEGRPALSGLPDGLRAEVSLVRSQVLVQGPATVIAALRERGRIAVRPIDLSEVSPNLSEPQELRIPLVIQVADGSIRTVEQPEAVVRISPSPETRVVGPVPVNVLASPELLSRFEVEVMPPMIALTVTAPLNRLRDSDPASLIRAYVDVVDARRSGSGEERTVRVLAPSWMTTTTTQVRVIVRPRSGLDDIIPGVVPSPVEPEPPAPPPAEDSSTR